MSLLDKLGCDLEYNEQCEDNTKKDEIVEAIYSYFTVSGFWLACPLNALGHVFSSH